MDAVDAAVDAAVAAVAALVATTAAATIAAAANARADAETRTSVVARVARPNLLGRGARVRRRARRATEPLGVPDGPEGEARAATSARARARRWAVPADEAH